MRKRETKNRGAQGVSGSGKKGKKNTVPFTYGLEGGAPASRPGGKNKR